MKTFTFTTTLTAIALTLAVGGAAVAAGYGNGPQNGQGKGNGQMMKQGQQMDMLQGQGFGKGRGMGEGRGQGKGQGRGQGRGQGKGMGQNGGQGQAYDADNMPAFLAGWDSDEDGIVSLMEASERRADLFAALDGDDNKIIDDGEFKDFLTGQEEHAEEEGAGHKRAMVGMTLDFNDLDKNGQVTEQEFVTQTKPWLARMDRDSDGKVTLQDFGRGRRGKGQGYGQGRN